MLKYFQLIRYLHLLNYHRGATKWKSLLNAGNVTKPRTQKLKKMPYFIFPKCCLVGFLVLSPVYMLRTRMCLEEFLKKIIVNRLKRDDKHRRFHFMVWGVICRLGRFELAEFVGNTSIFSVNYIEILEKNLLLIHSRYVNQNVGSVDTRLWPCERTEPVYSILPIQRQDWINRSFRVDEIPAFGHYAAMQNVEELRPMLNRVHREKLLIL